MKNQRRSILMVLFLMISIFSVCSIAQAEAEQPPYTYLNLDYATATADDAAAVLLAEKGITFERSPKVLSGTAEGLKEFGYDFRIQIDFKGNYTTINRILLSSAQPVRIPPDEFAARIQSGFEQFLDMENQLSVLYGEPDRRFFYRERKSVGDKGGRYMFESGIWELDALLKTCGTDTYFRAYSIWDNVVLMAWVDGQKMIRDTYMSRVMLTYYPRLKDTAALIEKDPAIYTEAD